MELSNKKDITKIVQQNLCNSCGTCLASCGPDSIHFEVTTGGHLFPVIDYNTCTDCGLCLAVCPGDHFTSELDVPEQTDPFAGNIIDVSVGKATDPKIFENSQSGGGVTAILQYLFDSGQIKAAIVTVGNTEGDPYSKPKIIYGTDELLSSQKSKYTPTDVNSLIPEIARIDGNIAVVGVSCHLHGLKNLSKYRKKLKGKIISIGLICDRVMTHASVDFFNSLAKVENPAGFVFRDKTKTGYPGDIVITAQNGKDIVLPKEIRWQMKDYFTPARCRLCFDKMNIYADIVVGDPHGITGADQQKGESLMITRTETGESIMQQVVKNNYFTSRPAPVDEALKGQNIEGKRKKWYAYFLAWQQMGRKTPDYPEPVEKFARKPSPEEIEQAQKSLQHALSLDTYPSRRALVQSALKHYKNQKLKNKLFLPLRLAKSLIKKIIK